MKNAGYRFWVILGPMVYMATFMIYFLKLALPIALIPMVATLSLLLCWRWKLKGLTVSIILLAASLGYYYPGLTADERFWQVGLAMSFALASLITALSSEETEAMIMALSVESESRLEHLRRLDEKLKMQKKAAKHESDDLKNQINKVLTLSAEKEGKVIAQEEVIEILREELKALRDTFSQDKIDPSVVASLKETVDTLSREKELLQSTLSKLQKELSHTTVSKA